MICCIMKFCHLAHKMNFILCVTASTYILSLANSYNVCLCEKVNASVVCECKCDCVCV